MSKIINILYMNIKINKYYIIKIHEKRVCISKIELFLLSLTQLNILRFCIACFVRLPCLVFTLSHLVCYNLLSERCNVLLKCDLQTDTSIFSIRTFGLAICNIGWLCDRRQLGRNVSDSLIGRSALCWRLAILVEANADMFVANQSH